MSGYDNPRYHRLFPSHSQFDYIHLTDLRRAIARHAGGITGKVLDYGCGLKPYSTLFKNVTEYTGADFADNRGADVHLDSTGSLPESLGGFDAVLSTQVLEHVPETHIYLSECYRVLAERKGKLLLTTHGIWEFHPSPRDLYRWTHEGLVHTIERHGFQTCSVEPITTGSKVLLQILASQIFRRRMATHSPIFWIMNHLADHLHENPDLRRRLQYYPICYLYLGRAGS